MLNRLTNLSRKKGDEGMSTPVAQAVGGGWIPQSLAAYGVLTWLEYTHR